MVPSSNWTGRRIFNPVMPGSNPAGTTTSAEVCSIPLYAVCGRAAKAAYPQSPASFSPSDPLRWVPMGPHLPDWCNGSTPDSDSGGRGSNPWFGAIYGSHTTVVCRSPKPIIVVRIHRPVPYSSVVKMAITPDCLSGDRGFEPRRNCHGPLV